MQNGFGSQSSNFVNYPDNDVNALLGIDLLPDSSSDVSPEQLNLLRLAAQEIGGAQFSSPKYDDKYYNFFEPSQRNSLPETTSFMNNYNRPNSLNLDMNYTNFENPYNTNNQRFPKFDGYKEQNQEADLLSYLNNLNLSMDRPRDDNPIQNNMDFKMPMDSHYQGEDFNKMQDKMFYNRGFQQVPPKNYNGENFYDMMSQINDRSPIQNFDFPNQNTPVSGANTMNFKPNGFHQNEFMQRRDMNQVLRENYPVNGALNDQRTNFENPLGNNQALMRQNQELARQMSLLMRNRPPPNPLNVDVSFLHENTPFNLGKLILLNF